MVLPCLCAASYAYTQVVNAIISEVGICRSGKLARKYHSITSSWQFHYISTFDQPLVKPTRSQSAPRSASWKEGFSIFPKHSSHYLQYGKSFHSCVILTVSPVRSWTDYESHHNLRFCTEKITCLGIFCTEEFPSVLSESKEYVFPYKSFINTLPFF